MIEFDLDIPSLSEEGIELKEGFNKPFDRVRELSSRSMIDWLLMIEMLIVLIISFDRIVETIYNYMNTIQIQESDLNMQMYKDFVCLIVSTWKELRELR